MPEVANFNPVPSKNPSKEPVADRHGLLLVSECLFEYSPSNAPTNGTTIIPNGGRRNTPTASPMVAPHIPRFVPPIFFVTQMGST